MSNAVSGRSVSDTDRLLAYVADLELEVNRLRRHSAFIEREATVALSRILRLRAPAVPGAVPPALAEVEAVALGLLDVVKDLHDLPGYHPAHDQVVAVAVRPLAEQVFRWQQRLSGAQEATLRLELLTDHIDWFPVRLRHILDNLIGHALRSREPAADAPWVSIGLWAGGAGYELRVSDNGPETDPDEDRRGLDLLCRTAGRGRGQGGGLAVARMLVEQSGGTLLVRPREECGTDVVLGLPRYDLLDYLE